MSKAMKHLEIGPQLHEVWRLSLPAILTQITTIAMQYIDSAMVGALGADASASIGLVTTTTWLLGGITSAVAAGFSVQAAHRLGAADERGARDVLRHGIIAALIISGLLCACGAAVSRSLPVWLGGDETLWRDSSAYFLIFSLMLPFSQINSLFSSFLQSAADMVTPSILNAVMCVLDVIFNALLIPRFGVAGAGAGTALACGVVSLAMARRCCMKCAPLRLRRETCAFDPGILKTAFSIGAPVAVQEVAMCSAMVASTVIIAPLGACAIAANSFAVTAEGLCYMPGYGIGAAAATLVGRSIGAGRETLARRYGWICTAMGGIFMGAAGLLMFFACPLVFSLLTPDAEVRALAAQVLRIGLIAEPLYGASIAAAGVLRGAGDTLVPSLLNLGSIWIVRIGLALLLTGRFGLPGMWTAMAAELCVRGLLMLLRQKTTGHFSRLMKREANSAGA